MSTDAYDWVYVAAGWVVGMAGAVLLVWALFRDRARGRRRCPRCWYDMAGVGGLRCPECGQEADGERRLSRTRRRWGWAAVATLIVGAGLGLGSMPAWRNGWERVVPGTVLALVARADAAPAGSRSGWIAFPTVVNGRVVVAGGAGPGGTPPAPSLSVHQRLTAEVWRRMRGDSMWHWQAAMFLRRYFDEHDISLEAMVRVPERWPVDRPLRVWLLSRVYEQDLSFSVRLPGGERSSASEIPLPVDAAMAAGDHVDLDVIASVNGVGMCSERVRAPIAIGGTVETFLDRVEDEATTAAVREALRPRVERRENQYVAAIGDRSETPLWEGLDLGIAYRLVLKADGRTVATGADRCSWDRAVWKDWEDVRLAWEPGGEATAAAARRLTLEVIGDPGAAGKQYVESPFTKGRAACWVGRFEVEVGK